jgi:nucleotide-binding universal stress UspA family protein
VVPLGAGLHPEAAYKIEQSDPAEAMSGLATKTQADLVVIGAHGSEKHLTLEIHFSYSIASSVVSNAFCPLLTVHS